MSTQEETVFTQDQVNKMLAAEKGKWETEVLNPLQQAHDDLLQFKPKEVDEKEVEHQKRMQELHNKEIEMELMFSGLEDFKEFLYADTIEEFQDKLKRFNKLLADKKIDNSWKPESHKQTDAYTHAKSQGDTLNMIKALFQKQ